MIKLELTVREAMYLATSWAYNNDVELYHKIVNAFEIKLGVNQNRMVTITGGMDTNNRIACIKAVRLWTGWGLKESKDWTDGMVGRIDESGFWRDGGNRISVTLKTPDAAENLLRDLVALGCEGYLS
jgi:ribosomal protein L7/L12